MPCIDIQDVAGAFAAEVFGTEVVGGFGDVLRKDASFEHASVAVKRLKLRFFDLVGGGTFLAPFALPNLGAANHSVWVDHIATNAVWRSFQGDAAAELDFSSFGSAIRNRLVAGDHAVFAGA